MIWFLWKLPSWLFFLNASEILMAASYALATNFAESLAVLLVPWLLSLILPRRWFRDIFVARGAALVIALLTYMIFLTYEFQLKSNYPRLPLPAWQLVLPAAAIPVVAYFPGKINLIRKLLESLADRATIFLYVTVPASMMALMAILIRVSA